MDLLAIFTDDIKQYPFIVAYLPEELYQILEDFFEAKTSLALDFCCCNRGRFILESLD